MQVLHYIVVTVNHPEPVSKTTSVLIFYDPMYRLPVYDTCS